MREQHVSQAAFSAVLLPKRYNVVMTSAAIRYLIYSRLCFFGAIGVCILISRAAITTNVGISYYGAVSSTLVPYAAGFLLTCWFVVQAVLRIDTKRPAEKYMVRGLIALVVLMIAVLAIPYDRGFWIYWLHVALGTSLFLVEMAMAIWMSLRVQGDAVNRGLFALMSAAGIVSALSLVRWASLMVPGQLVYELCFTLILLRAAHFMAVKASRQ
ncbi:MAG TPA: hypothetical protein VFL85_05615 [Candidatus Saccharimonadales bacterium]|nr:hypothetical protein [Candidatus Saccharimonadales bacterium]